MCSFYYLILVQQNAFLLKTTEGMLSLRSRVGHSKSLYGNGHSKKCKRMIPSRERVLSKARLIYENDHSKKRKRMISSRERALSKSRLIYENDHSKNA